MAALLNLDGTSAAQRTSGNQLDLIAIISLRLAESASILRVNNFLTSAVLELSSTMLR
jgi:hypothetical protein